MANAPKIILYDVETSPMITATFTLYPDSINHTNIIQDWFMICAAWKELGSTKTKSISINDFKRKSKDDDYGVVKMLSEELSDADIIVGHNSDKFDSKKLNARLLYHGLPPMPKIQSVDTLKEIKKIAQFSSHRLDYLGSHLNGAGKLDTSPGLWLRAMEGDRKAVKEMVEYNVVDVVRLEELYLKIRPYMRSHPNMAAYGVGRHEGCNNCGSDDLIISKTRFTKMGIERVQKQCKKCKAYSTFPK